MKTSHSSLTQADLEQLAAVGITAKNALDQSERIAIGFAPVELTAPCTPSHGLRLLDDSERARFQSVFKNSQKSWSRFVPASGASSRMFQDWVAAVNENRDDHPEVLRWNHEALRYPFVPMAPAYPGFSNKAQAVFQGLDGLKYLLNDLGFAKLPKAAIPFHRYGDGTTRTPLDEHLSEADATGLALHLTLSPEHESLFHHLLGQNPLAKKVDTSYSFQSPASQSLSLDLDGNWVRQQDGSLLLRPSGHGALLENLQSSPTPWIFVRNIDNVVPEGPKRELANEWREALAGLLEESWRLVQSWKADLLENCSPERSTEIFSAAKGLFCWQEDSLDTAEILVRLQAPIRVCGMVKNTGEPGGGPFLVRDSRGHHSLQIVESAQVNKNDPDQLAIFQGATHFNPVELVCSLERFDGSRFKLADFVDAEMGFRVEKSFGGKPLRALEKPGLWNGSMAFWLTIFVEIPEICFAPVKTVHDLLRPEHQI